MITRHHVALALLCSLTISCATAGFDPFFAIVATGGTLIGVLVPDIHMKRPKKNGFLTIGWCIMETGRQACVPVMCGIYRIFPGTIFERKDKRLTHSVPGLLLYSAIAAALLIPPAIFSRNSAACFFLTVFLGGIVLGFILHLVEDLCTRKGIPVLFPFSGLTIRGSIRPCDFDDHRIGNFHVQHCLVLGTVAVLCSIAQTPELRIVLGFLGVTTGVAAMILQSDVRITPAAQIIPDVRDGVVA